MSRPNGGNGGGGYTRPTDPQYLVLQERVYGVEQGMRSIENAISALGAKMEERGKIPWPALGVMLSFLVVIGGLVWWPVKDNQIRTIDVLDKLSDRMVTKTENDLRFNTSAQRRDDLQRLTDIRVGRIEQDVSEIEKRIVPRGEHAEGWQAQRGRDSDLQRQIDDLRKGFGDLYSPKDALKSMQQRIDELERMIRPKQS